MTIPRLEKIISSQIIISCHITYITSLKGETLPLYGCGPPFAPQANKLEKWEERADILFTQSDTYSWLNSAVNKMSYACMCKQGESGQMMHQVNRTDKMMHCIILVLQASANKFHDNYVVNKADLCAHHSKIGQHWLDDAHSVINGRYRPFIIETPFITREHYAAVLVPQLWIIYRAKYLSSLVNLAVWERCDALYFTDRW